MDRFVEESDALIKRIDAAISLGESTDAILAIKRIDPDLVLDCRLFIHELGNLPLWQEVEDVRNVSLPRLRSLLEKVPDIVALRKHIDG